MKHETARRIERADMQEWDRQYRAILGPVVRTEGCTCDWVSVRELCSAEDTWHLVALDPECPDHN